MSNFNFDDFKGDYNEDLKGKLAELRSMLQENFHRREFYTVIDNNLMSESAVHISQAFEVQPRQLTVFLNVTKGHVFDGLASYNLIQNIGDINVTTVNIGMVAEAGLLIFLAGKERVCFESSGFVFNNFIGFENNIFSKGNKEDTKWRADINDKVVALLTTESDISAVRWREYLKNGKYFSAEEAKGAGLVHHIVRRVR